LIDWMTAIPPDSSGKMTGAIHGLLNTAVLVLFIFVAAERREFVHAPSSLSLILSTIGIALLGISGWLGGTLSYDLQVGVFRRQTQSHPLIERTIAGFNYPVCHQSELADGQMMLIHNRGPEDRERIVVGKIPEGYYAFSDHCPHKGGPLCDGALAGSTVQCPWHGSQFDIRTGRVVAGPASKPIKVFNIRVRDGEVYLVSAPAASYSQKRAS
jgi:nitrite reductase/ring-hydroxylating ferredoxin subunit